MTYIGAGYEIYVVNKTNDMKDGTRGDDGFLGAKTIPLFINSIMTKTRNINNHKIIEDYHISQ